MIRVGVLGAKGRMGSEVVKAVTAADGLEITSSLDIGDSLDELVATKTEVVVDFTTPDSVMKNLEFLISHDISAFVGTTGFDEKKLAALKALLSSHPKVGV